MTPPPDLLPLCRRLRDDLHAFPRERQARRTWAPRLAYGRHAGPARSGVRQAATAVLLVWDGRRWTIPLTVRPTTLSRHGGQVCFPGGLIEAGELSQAAARRELQDELGAEPAIDWLGPLEPLHVFASDVVMRPWLGIVATPAVWAPDAREVDAVVELPVRVLADPQAIVEVPFDRGGWHSCCPTLTYVGRRIWGATAVVLGELAHRLHRTGWPQE